MVRHSQASQSSVAELVAAPVSQQMVTLVIKFAGDVLTEKE